MYNILVPTDGSPLSLKAAKEAATLAKPLKARITALYVSPSFSPPIAEHIRVGELSQMQAAYKKSAEAQAAKAMDRVEALARAANVACDQVHVVGFDPWDGIVRTARKHKVDMIVMASHGRGGLAGLLLGSETTKVLAHSRIPVLVCR